MSKCGNISMHKTTKFYSFHLYQEITIRTIKYLIIAIADHHIFYYAEIAHLCTPLTVEEL
jgi:hypothetical protein